MLYRMIDQIKSFYPDARIHLMTNTADPIDGVILHYFDFESNHSSKFYLYGLLDVPAMYLDVDIVLLKPFKADHLVTESPFNLYCVSFFNDLQKMSRKPLPVKTNKVLNAGIIWIPRPSKQITQELIDIHTEYFSDVNYMLNQGNWPCVDEYALAVYIEKHSLKMNMSSEVNRSRHSLRDLVEAKQCQTVHYPGISAKRLYEKEYHVLTVR